ncbi:MAG: glycosyltransferase family 4 protein [Pseudomonadota bacterium]|nr:glycosyltransferase family 4 protein [Pseudomonadota bacterium]
MSSHLPPRRPRVAYLITNSEVGGAQAHVADLLNALHGRVDAVVLAGGDGPLFDAAQSRGANTIRLTLLDNALSPRRALSAFKQLIAALRTTKPDLIHAQSAKAGALGRLAGWVLGIPVVYTVHGFAFKPAAPLRQRLVARVVEWILAPLTARMICVAEAERAMANTLPIASKRVSVIRNGIADTTAAPAVPGAAVVRIVMVARLAAPKRPDLVIRAFAQATLPDCELVLAGDGPQMEALSALADAVAPGKVRFLGAIPDVPSLLASAQIFVLASDHEGFPLSILEAMRAGLPIIASDLPGIREQLADGSCGRLVPASDVQAWAETLAQLAANGAERERLGNDARQYWEQHFGMGNMADATWQVYQEVLVHRGANHSEQPLQEQTGHE